jgi:hypothetical protein
MSREWASYSSPGERERERERKRERERIPLKREQQDRQNIVMALRSGSTAGALKRKGRERGAYQKEIFENVHYVHGPLTFIAS